MLLTMKVIYELLMFRTISKVKDRYDTLKDEYMSCCIIVSRLVNVLLISFRNLVSESLSYPI